MKRTKAKDRGRSRRDRKVAQLSQMELKVMGYLVRGMTINNTAEELGITRNTADTYVRRIYRKLGVHSRAEAVFHFVGGTLPKA